LTHIHPEPKEEGGREERGRMRRMGRRRRRISMRAVRNIHTQAIPCNTIDVVLPLLETHPLQ